VCKDVRIGFALLDLVERLLLEQQDLFSSLEDHAQLCKTSESKKKKKEIRFINDARSYLYSPFGSLAGLPSWVKSMSRKCIATSKK